MYNSEWYRNLIKPEFTPPASVFKIVWPILYSLMFIALILFIKKRSYKSKTQGYIYFFIQLILNFLWSPVFFHFQNIGFALIVLLLLDIFVILTAIQFFKICKFAGYLLIPYILWIIFATYLNLQYYMLN